MVKGDFFQYGQLLVGVGSAHQHGTIDREKDSKFIMVRSSICVAFH